MDDPIIVDESKQEIEGQNDRASQPPSSNPSSQPDPQVVDNDLVDDILTIGAQINKVEVAEINQTPLIQPLVNPIEHIDEITNEFITSLSDMEAPMKQLICKNLAVYFNIMKNNQKNHVFKGKCLILFTSFSKP